MEKSKISQREEEILQYWKDNKIFEKTLEKPSPKGNFVFYDGPPFATGLPHYGHIVPGTMKDVIPRYKTMRGHFVRRVWGWDCHGLPVENLIQEELGVETKKDIEELGIEKFNQAARDSVFRYDEEWKKIVPRTGRWVDMDSAYTTMDSNYTESVWWAFKELNNKGLVYEDFKSMHISPLLETPLSNFEVSQNYKDIEDISVYAKFELVDEPGTYMVAWTTTPWTLFGNAALAVGEDIKYVKAQKEGENIIVAKDLAEKVLKEDYEVIEEVQGKELVGKKYKPVFNHYSSKEDLENKENAWKVYGADFVSTEDGTGIVHIASAFGEDDLNLGRENNLPFIQHVNIDGSIKDEIPELAGRQAKPKATEEEPKKHQETDIEVLRMLAHSGKLFDKEKYTHSYPHCWRTDAPLLNYAMSSWFIRVTELKNKLVSENKKINWVPEDIKEGRFGKWLEGARDWAVSRSRYWGTPIPIWKSEDGDVEVIGSLQELQEKAPDQIIDMYVMRHAESQKNVLGVYDDEPDKYGLTDKGIEEAKRAARDLEGKIDLIISSPVRRCRETAGLVSKELGVELIESEGLTEVDSGSWDGKKVEEVRKLQKEYTRLSEEEHYVQVRGETGESWKEIEERGYRSVSDAIKEYKGKRILFVTHGGVLAYVLRRIKKLSLSQTRAIFSNKDIYDYAKPTNLKVDLNTMKAFDFHRPYIDQITWKNESGKTMKRIPDVFDTWIDSGSMPYASVHYPFENKEAFEKSNSPLFPADFIAEGQDQTRGWFYVLSVLNNGLFGRAPFRNVIVNGLVLAEDGKKMSKRLKNYPDISYILDGYGADALRYYMLSSPVVRAEDLNFSEKGVDEVVKKLILRLKNVASFYDLYKKGKVESKKPKANHVLDKWILARLKEVNEQVTSSLESYELDRACRPFNDFIDDLSTWYLRRSRERIKDGDKEALDVLGHVLLETSKLLAPIMPFLSEDLYLSLSGDKESVHLEDWPKGAGFWERLFGSTENVVLGEMQEIRSVISEALEQRAKEGVKVRQPLASLTVSKKYSEDLIDLIKDEVNVKEVLVGEKVGLDFEVTKDLKEEGVSRDVVRFIQDLRKKAKLMPDDIVDISISGEEKILEIVKKYTDYISKQTRTNISFKENEGEDLKTDLGSLKIKV